MPRGLRALRQALRTLRGHRANLAAAGCAFFATLSLFPAITLLLSLYGLLFSVNGVVPELEILRGVLPDETHAVIVREVRILVNHPHRTLGVDAVLGGVVTLWSAANGTGSMLAALTLAYDGVEPARLRLHLTSLAITMAALGLATLVLALLVALAAWIGHFGLPAHALHLLHTPAQYGAPLQGALRHKVLLDTWVLHEMSLVVLTCFVAACFAMLYRFGPVRRPRGLRIVWPGAVTATVLWLAASTAFSVYVAELAGLDAMYGPIGATAGLMLWFYVGAWVTLLGAELNAALERDRDGAPPARDGQAVSGSGR